MDGRQKLLASESRIPSGVRRNIAAAVTAGHVERGVSSETGRLQQSGERSRTGAVGSGSDVLPALLVHVMSRWVGGAGDYRRSARGGVCVYLFLICKNNFHEN